MRQNVRELALDGLIQVEKSGAYSNLLLNNLIEKSAIDRKDIGLLTEIVYGTIQRRDTLDYYLQPFLKKKVEAWVSIASLIFISNDLFRPSARKSGYS